MTAGVERSGWLHRAADSDIWWSFKSSPMTVVAAIGTVLIVAVAFLSPVLAPHTPFDPATLSLSDGLKPPVLLSADGDWAFPLGTDDQGRDILSSIMYGTRLSLVVGFASVAVAMTLGITLGLLSGYLGGAVDALLSGVCSSGLREPHAYAVRRSRARGECVTADEESNGLVVHGHDAQASARAAVGVGGGSICAGGVGAGRVVGRCARGRSGAICSRAAFSGRCDSVTGSASGRGGVVGRASCGGSWSGTRMPPSGGAPAGA